jgi:DNA-binding LacI/PurR family transcriptional regulator
MPNTKVKIDDVARAANVSVSTVSRALNNRPDVAEKTRQHVLQVIAELGYEPNVQAQGLAAGQARTISLLFSIPHTQTTQLELDFFVSAAQTAGEHGYNLNLMVSEVDAAGLTGLYHRAEVAGVILMQIELEDWRVNLLRQQQLPFVMIGRCSDNNGLSFVDFDFEGAVQTAFGALKRDGHKHMGFLSRPRASAAQGLGPAVRLMRGYETATADMGLTTVLSEVAPDMEATHVATQTLLSDHPEITAIVTVNANTAAAVIRAAVSLGREVPTALSVIAIGTASVAQIVNPPLTTIDFPSARMGATAAEMLINHITADNSPVEQVLISAELIKRESSRPREGYHS